MESSVTVKQRMGIWIGFSRSIQGIEHNRIANIVRSIKVLVSKEIGEPIFQRSYYDHVIRNQQDYNEVWEYIENNPRKWIVQNRGCE